MQEIYVFDLDGTLVDSMRPAVRLVLSILDEYGIPYEKDIAKTLTPLGFKGISVYYAETLGVPLTPDEIYAEFVKRLQRLYADEVQLKTGVRSALERLKERGASLNVLTASPHIFTDACLKNNGIYHLFDNVWSSEDFGLLKGDGRIYGEVAKRLNVTPQDYFMVDDSYKVLCASKGAGTRTIGVFEEMTADEWDKIKRIADCFVRDLSEIE